MTRQSESIAGVALAHAKAIAQVARRQNCFIFIRPSTKDTVRLIEAGFATKSNDVHDKSSDWGPMAGFVPIDQGLNKKSNSPSAGKARLAGNYHQHGIESEVHLKIGRDLAASQPMYPVTDEGHRVVSAGKGFRTLRTGENGSVVPFSFYRARKHRDPVFARRESDGCIYWIDATSGALVPVYVWGYHGVAITGDYDLWMVAPHMSNADKQGLSSLVKIYTAVDAHKTPSAASPFLLRLNNTLNRACKEALPKSKQVFNHGAEAQNYGFTQALDDQMAMFTPNGGFRNIAWHELADAINEMEHRGYLVIRNRKWTASNPTLSGEKRTDGHYMWKVLLAGLRKDRWALAAARAQLEEKRGKKAGPDGQYAWTDPDKKKGYESRLEERRRLSLFGQGLKGMRAGGGTELFALDADDFPANTREPIGEDELAAVRGHADQATFSMQGAGANTVGHVKLDLTSQAGQSIDRSNAPFRALERDAASRQRHIERIRAARGLR